ncbi:cystathionine gamma-synthase [Spirochaetia bacterium]|nr:cystathionine gamma-synthase [Spirochaetia bacterium]
MKYDTLVIHNPHAETEAGHLKDAFGAVVPPVYLSTTYAQSGLGDYQRYMYIRGGNPTRNALEGLVARLEEARYGFAFSSGMAATGAVFNLFSAGDTVLLNNNVYGGTFRYVSKLFQRRNLGYRLVDNFNTLDFAALTPDVKAVFIETPSNPLLQVTDIRRVADAAHKKGITVIIDNTFMTSYFQKPLQLGADIVVYSATKYYSGHSDILAGLVIVNDAGLAEQFKFLQNTLGSGLSPQDSYMLQRSIKTLALRLDRHEKNTNTVVAYLQAHPKAARVFYPTVHDEERRIQASQSTGNGAVLSLVLSEDCDPAKFIAALSLFDLAVSLGSVESLVCHPASMTHESFPADLQKKVGIEANLIRLSIGIENIDDLIADLAQGLAAAVKKGGP